VLVVEAGAKSGSLITAGCAVDQGREVFSIPGSVLTTAYTGANNLIRDGAKAVSCARDILESYAVMYPDRLDMSKADSLPDYESVKVKPTEPIPVKKEMPEDLDPNAKMIYGLFGSEPLHPDDIAAETSLPMPKVISALMMLEINGLIKQTNGKNYILNN
jgi:DNA processing protein